MSGSDMDGDRLQANAFVDQFTALPVQHVLFNSAVTRITPTEVQCALSFGQRPLALLIISPVMAKTLAEALLERVSEYENLTNQKVMTIAEIAALADTRN